jgi:hypothetical protein
MSNRRHVFTADDCQFQWVRQKTLSLCSDCAFQLPGPYSRCCEDSTSAFDCKKEQYGAWKQVGLGK